MKNKLKGPAARGFWFALIFITGVGLPIITGCSASWANSMPRTEGISGEGPSNSSTQSLPICTEAEDCFEQAQKDFHSGMMKEAHVKLKEVRKRFGGTPWADRAALLMGKAALESQEEVAVPLFEEAMGLVDIQDYILFYQAHSYQERGLAQESIDLFSRLISDHPDSILIPEALYEKSRVLSKLKEFESSKKGFKRLIKRYPKDKKVPEALLGLARASLALGEPSEVLRSLRRIWTEYPTHESSGESAKLLLELESRQVDLPGPTLGERYRRGRNLYKRAKYNAAVTEFLAVSQSEQDPNHHEAHFKLALSYVHLKRYSEARPLLEAIAFKGSQSKRTVDALFWLARVGVRIRNEALVMRSESKLSSDFRKSDQRARVLLYLGEFYEDRNKPEKARKAYQRVLKDFGRAPLAQEALWQIVWMDYRAGRFKDSIETISSSPTRQFERDDGGRLIYWKGRSAENLGQNSEAVKTYQELCAYSLATFYCQMATDRLKKMDLAPELISQSVDSETIPVLQKKSLNGPLGRPSAALLKDLHFRKAQELERVGLSEEASKELNFIIPQYRLRRADLFHIARELRRFGDFGGGLRILRLYFQDYLARSSDQVPGDFWEIVYPVAVVDFIKKQEVSGSIDPYVAAAVMREESAYDAKAVSIVGAIGLMQLMPETADWVAMRLGHRNFNPAYLYQADLNAQYGAWYLGHLARRFDGNVVLTVPSYNAGPEAVSRWVKAHPIDPDSLDEFVESIPFSETRAFTKRVLRSYTELLRAGGNDLQDRFSRPVLQP